MGFYGSSEGKEDGKDHYEGYSYGYRYDHLKRFGFIVKEGKSIDKPTV